MTREELKEHCEKQIKNCEMWATYHGEEPHGKIYEEHKLILELLEQEPILDQIRAEIEKKHARAKQVSSVLQMNAYTDCLQIIDKYRGE